ncbi:hypothetical protein WV31_05380 [Magnetospirillum sp. ME-1]|uniref:sensor histidine kinase n=1 Tax=Magnetospirillum sp. ME-1 TaxID=1639348 RepID=UPI000A17A50F|nr:ATP-binding protein [Magnetospirillum sp. ME-1]ARJ65132.1 hypothetical protein WV31_05380 [Magnetospirillum sp. ME-1]
MKTSRKIFGLTYLISVLAIAGIALFTLSRTTATLHDLSRQRLSESVNRESRIIYNTLDMVRSDLQVLAEEGGAGASKDPETRRRLTERYAGLMQKRPAYTRILLQPNTAGAATISVEQTELGLRAKGVGAAVESDFVMMAEEAVKLWPGNVTLSQVMVRNVRDEVDQKARVIYAATPVATKDGRVEGALVIAIDFDTLVGGFGRPRTDITFFIGNRDGEYLYRPTGQQETKSITWSNSMIRDFRLGERWQKWSYGSDPQLRFDSPETHMAVVLYRVLLADPLLRPNAPVLVVGGAASLTEMDNQILGFRTELAVMALVVGGMVAFALALATKYLTQPIQELTLLADRIRDGERDITSPASGRRDEFGVLARAMMRMLEALRDAAKNEEQAALGRMATMIAHDIRNALSSVKMNLKILDNHHRAVADEFSDGCDIALRQVSYMENILTDMLDFARPNGLEPDWVDLDDVIEVATVSMLPEITEQSIVVCTDGHHSLPKVWGDRTRLIQVFQNLLANAIQAMEPGGHLTIEARSALFKSRPAVEVSIADTGSGIPDSIHGKVLEPFFTTRAKGTGLGLTIVHRLVKSHDGELHLEPNPSGGTIARVILPLVSPHWQAEQSMTEIP